MEVLERSPDAMSKIMFASFGYNEQQCPFIS